MSKLGESGHYIIHVLLFAVVIWAISGENKAKVDRSKLIAAGQSGLYIFDTQTKQFWKRTTIGSWYLGTLENPVCEVTRIKPKFLNPPIRLDRIDDLPDEKKPIRLEDLLDDLPVEKKPKDN